MCNSLFSQCPTSRRILQPHYHSAWTEWTANISVNTPTLTMEWENRRCSINQTKWRKKSFVNLLEIISVPEINGTNSAVSDKFQGWYVRHSAERYARAVQSHGPLGRTGGRRGCRICTWNKLLLTICVGPTGCENVRQNTNRAECARTATVRINLYVALITGVP